MAVDQSPKSPNVGRASIIMMASIFLSRILGLLRDTVMSAMFGRGELTDAYALAFQIPDFIFYLLASGALSSAFIPVFSEYFHTDKKKDAWYVFSTVVTYTALIVGSLIILAFIFTEPLLTVVAGGKEIADIPLIARMSRIILPAQFAFLIGGLMFGTLYARQKFIAPGLGPNIYNLSIIIGAIGISHFVEPGIVGMAWGALSGAIIGNLILPFFIMKKTDSHFSPSLNYKHPGVQKVFKFMIPVIFGLSLPAFYGMIMKAMASYYPDGIVTSIELSNKLMQAPLGIFGQALALAAFPTLAQFYAQKRLDLFRGQLERSLRTILYVCIPVSVIMYFLSEEIVTAILQYGKFKAADTKSVANCLSIFCYGIAAWCMQPILMRAYYAAQNTLKPVLLGTATTGVFALLAYSLQKTPLVHLGLPMAGSISACFLAIIMLLSIRKDIGELDFKGILTTMYKSTLASLSCAIVLMFGLKYMPDGIGYTDNLAAFTKLFILGLGAAWVYYFTTKKLGMKESEFVRDALNRKRKRNAKN